MSNKTLDKSAVPDKARSKEKKPYDPEKLIGKTLAGRYEVDQCIGKGGMGVVYLARQSALGRNVVLKVLPRSFLGDDEAVGRFEREARGMSRLQHPNIVAIYDFGLDADQAFICMEYVDGGTLSRRIRHGGAMAAEEFASIASQILQGIGEAHSMGLIHRDIKPSNIMLTERHGRHDYVKILDFGLAKLIKGSTDVTKEQALVGSTAFLSPEQILGQQIDHRVDIYAMGVLFYYMLSAQKPFTADDDINVLYQHVHNPPPPLREKLPPGHQVPDALIALIERMLAKAPGDRPPDAPHILRELADIMAGSSALSPGLSGHPSSGEFASLSQNSSGTFEDPSDRIGRSRAHTPAGSSTPNTSVSHDSLPSWQSGSHNEMSFVTGEQMLQIQKEHTRRTLVIALVVLIATALAAFLWFKPMAADPVPVAAQPDEPAPTPSGPTVETTRAQLAEVATFIDDKKFGLAEDLLNLIQPTLSKLPELKPEYAASRDRLETARLLAQAKMYEEQGKPTEAIQAYQKIRRRNPAHTQARAALRRLQASPAKGAPESQSAEETAATAAETSPRRSKKRRARKESREPAAPAEPVRKKPASTAYEASEESTGINLLPIGDQPDIAADNDAVPLLKIE